MINGENLKLFKPVQAIIVFQRNTDEFYLQTHEIVDNKYSEGRPFHRDQLKELALVLNSKGAQMTELRGMLPERILYYQPSITGTKIMWYVPKAKRALKFSASLKLKSATYQVPSMIFAVNDKALTVLAYKGTGKPNTETKLYHVPLFNINNKGLVCMGTTSESNKKPYLDDEMDRHERRFFGSNFTHTPNAVAKGWTVKKIWNSKAATRFPEASLSVSTFKNLGSFVKSFVSGKGGDAW